MLDELSRPRQPSPLPSSERLETTIADPFFTIFVWVENSVFRVDENMYGHLLEGNPLLFSRDPASTRNEWKRILAFLFLPIRERVADSSHSTCIAGPE